MKINNTKGVTLVELMLSVAIATVIAYAIFLAMRVTITSFDTDNVKMALQTSTREGLYRMAQEIRESGSTTAPSQVTISTTAATNDTITFYVPNSSSPVTAGYAVNWGHQIKYAPGSGSNSTNIIRTDLTANTTTVMARDISAITFTGNASPPTVVTITMTAQKTLTNGRTIPATITGQAKIRNS